jgi:hypothetical protein
MAPPVEVPIDILGDHSYGIPIRELWGIFGHSTFERKLFAVLTGYIDEGFNEEWFTLSCLIGWGGMWFWIENEFEKLLEKTNASLKAQGRPTISRYHATDCSNLKNEFRDWSVDEQIEFTKGIVQIVRTHPLVVVSYSINLKELVKEIPETKSNLQGFAYVLLLYHLMVEIGNVVLSQPRYSKDRLALVHERCPFDSALLEAFNQMKNDESFQYRDRFTTIVSMGWEDCVPLQLADLLAYENFKEAQRSSVQRPRRKSLASLLDLNNFGGRAKGLDRHWIREYKKVFDAMDETTKHLLLTTARIVPKSRTKKHS